MPVAPMPVAPAPLTPAAAPLSAPAQPRYGHQPPQRARARASAKAVPTRQSTEQTVREDDFSLVDALLAMLDRGASDLHLTSGAKPTIRVNGSLVPIEDFDVLTPPVLQRVIYSDAHPGASA